MPEGLAEKVSGAGHGGVLLPRAPGAGTGACAAETDFIEQRFGAGKHPGGLHFRDVAGAAEITVDARRVAGSGPPPASSQAADREAALEPGQLLLAGIARRHQQPLPMAKQQDQARYLGAQGAIDQRGADRGKASAA